jgi:hypothetical protein
MMNYARDIFRNNDGAVTKRYYAELSALGPIGLCAINLFRAQKCSARAKKYRGGNDRGSYSSQAYERKNWSLGQLVQILGKHGDYLGIKFGWGRDEKQTYNPWVVYIDLPNGQVSFHSQKRFGGPDYPGEWDQQHASEDRIMAFCDVVMSQAEAIHARPVRE